MSLFTINVVPSVVGDVLASDASASQMKAARRREILTDLANYFEAVASGVKSGTVDIQLDTAATTPTFVGPTGVGSVVAAETITFSSVAAGEVIAVNGVYFYAVSGTPIRSLNQFKVGVTNTADAADFALTFNGSAQGAVAVAAAAVGVVTLTSLLKGAQGNAITVETIGALATGTLTPVTAVATNTIVINGVTLTAEKEMARQTATVSTGNAGDTVVVNGVTFTCVASGATGNQFNKGGTDTITCANLAAAINASTSAKISGVITATSATTTLSLRAVASGTAANSFALTATGGWTATGATLTGGLATSNNKFDYGDTNDQTVNEIVRAIQASTSAGINRHVLVNGVHQVTISSGSGVETIFINGIAISSTWATSDTVTAAALVTALNANATIAALLVATSAAGVITLAPLVGKSFSLYATGTGVTISSFVNVYAAYPGVNGNCIQTSTTGGTITASVARLAGGTIAQNEGAQASGQVTISSGSGTETITINGVNITATWGTSDTATATQLVTNINTSTNALIQNLVYATSAAGVITIKSIYGGVSGNSISLAASGTGCSVTSAWAGGADPTHTAIGGTGVLFSGSFPGARAAGGVSASANAL